jgi:hypothetical protein
MLRHKMMSAELYYELRKLKRGVDMTICSSLKIGHFFIKKAKLIMGKGFWLFLESPKLWEKIGPDKSMAFEAQKEHRPYMHPPSSFDLR